MSDLPPLPSGFELEGSSPQAASLPPLPAGFQMEVVPPKPQGFVGNVMDAVKGIPRNLAAGLLDAATTGAHAEAHSMSQPDLAVDIPNTEQALKAIEPVTGELYAPQGALGKIVGAGARTLTNPASYVGPGGLGLKFGSNILSGMGGEAAGQMAEGTKYEVAARLAGSVAGGLVGSKMFGPAAETAAVPTQRELKVAADKGYTAARASGVEVDPKGLAGFANQAQQDLTTGDKFAFTGGPDGTAPKTLAILDKLQSPPADATVTASNLDTLRRQINNIAGETKDFKPTADAKAAMVLKNKFADYLENIPQDHVVAGNAEDFVRNIKEANGNYAAASRLGTFDARIAKAGNQVDRQIAGSLDARIKNNVGSVLDNPKQLRGLTPDEIKQIQLINSGTPVSNTLRQLGRGGAGVIPMGTHIGAAVASGGATLPASVAIGIPLYVARKVAEGMTVSRANDLASMLAKRSPEYLARLAKVPPAPSQMGNWAAIARAPMLGMQ